MARTPITEGEDIGIAYSGAGHSLRVEGRLTHSDSAPLRIPGAPPSDIFGLPRATDTCEVCGAYTLLEPGSDLCPGCTELARWAAELVQEDEP
jgi:hypothetical protein